MRGSNAESAERDDLFERGLVELEDGEPACPVFSRDLDFFDKRMDVERFFPCAESDSGIKRSFIAPHPLLLYKLVELVSRLSIIHRAHKIKISALAP